MKNLNIKIKLYANKEIDFRKDVLLQDDSNGKGTYIKEWNLDIPKPTDEQLNLYENVANIVEANAQVVATRKSLYGSVEYQIEFITENGVEAWQEKVNQIKLENPKG
jgi:hypothetical protein